MERIRERIKKQEEEKKEEEERKEYEERQRQMDKDWIEMSPGDHLLKWLL